MGEDKIRETFPIVLTAYIIVCLVGVRNWDWGIAILALIYDAFFWNLPLKIIRGER